jgi:hypothetical protein
VRFWGGWFSKKGLDLKVVNQEQMGEISTFQATTVTATSIFLLFSCFLEAVAPLHRRKRADAVVAQK